MATVTVAARSTYAATLNASAAVGSTQVGVSPLYLGYNMAHYMSGSNTSAWVGYQSANAFRVWANATDYDPGTSNYGDGVSTLPQFEASKSVVRSSPESNGLINWAGYNARWGNVQSGRNKVQLNYILPELQKLGVEPVMQLSRSNTFSNSGWGGHWEQWKFYYTVAYWSAKNYDVQRYQMWNEPDITGATMSDWVNRLQLASDAVKSAIEDVNRDFGKQLSWSMNAPVAADQDGTVDSWGAAALQANRTDYAGNTTTYDIFDTYDVHRYNTLGSAFAADQQLFDAKIPQHNASGANLPVTYTEFNRFQSSSGSWTAAALDNAQHAAEYGSIFPQALGENVYGMYAFKFGQTLWDNDENGSTPDVPQATGFHFVENSGTYGIKGATRGGEVMRMVIKAFKGQRPRFAANVNASNGNYEAATSEDAARGRYFYYAVNRDTANSYDTALDLSSWDVAAGQMIAVQEVSGAHLGAVKQYITVPANKQITFNQPATSVVLLTIPSGQSVQTRTDLIATEDAYVSKASPTVNQGANVTTAKVDRSASTTADDVAYMKFSLGATARANVSRAVLNVTGANTANSTSTIVHVYGILTDTWTESGITWNNAPNLGSGVSDAKLSNVGSDAFPVGQLTWNNATQEWGVDVTDFVRRQQADANLSFVLIREERFSGDSDTSVITINSSENASGKPRLSVFTTPTGLFEWKKNLAGTTHTWSTASNWDAGAPTSGASTVALLGDFITSPHTINLASNATVGELRFDGLNTYTLTGTSTLSFSGAISAYKGEHKLDVPVAMTGAGTVRVDPGANLIVSKAITSSNTMTKTGGGTLMFTSPQTFGPVGGNGLAINAGVVELSSTFSRGLSIASGGTLSGAGTVSGAVTSSGTIAPGGVGIAGAPITLNGGLTLNSGASLDFDFAIGTSDRIAGSGALTLSGGPGTVAINLHNLGGLENGDFTLIDHSNALANIDALFINAAPSGTFQLLNNANAVVLRVSDIGAAALAWRGNTDGTWDNNVTSNWTGASGKFSNGNEVIFDDSATGTTSINVAAAGVSPASVILNNSSKSYTIAGGSINGSGFLTKNGLGSLTLTSSNNFTGPVQLNGGTITLSSGAALGSASGSVTLGSVTLNFTGGTTLGRSLTVNSASTINTGANNVTFAGTMSGSGLLTKTGTGTLKIAASAGGFSGGWNLADGALHVADSNGLGAGAVTIGAATLRLDNANVTAPSLTFSNQSTLVGTGTTRYTKSNFPAISNSATTVTWSTLNATDNLSFGSAIRNTTSGLSSATISIAGPGIVVLNSGGLSSGTTYSGSWNVTSGALQLGPNTTGSSEAMNALGFKNGDAKQANAVTVTGGMLVGAVNAPQAANVGTTPAFFRSGIALVGGALASTGVNASYGGEFVVGAGTSQIRVDDPFIASTPRDVNLVAGAAGANNLAASTSWIGNLVVTPGALATGGAFNIARDGGAVIVAPGATIQINAGATVNLGGTADALNDGFDRVHVLNDSTTGLNVNTGAKNVGNIDGTGNATVATSVSLTASRVRQNTVTANGALTMRDNGSISDVNTLTIGAAGKVDLRDNDMIIRTTPLGAWNNTNYTGVLGLVRKGRNDGTWTGAGGLLTSMADAVSELTTLAVATASDLGVTTFSGRTVAGDDVLVAYTFAGDANLSGFVDADDYFQIDSHYGKTTTGIQSFFNGDFDYDGDFDGDDYFQIDNGFLQQSAALPAASSVAPVPEPSSLLVLTGAAALTLTRRRRV